MEESVEIPTQSIWRGGRSEHGIVEFVGGAKVPLARGSRRRQGALRPLACMLRMDMHSVGQASFAEMSLYF